MKFLKTLILPTVVATSCLLSLGTSFANANNQSEQVIEVKADEPVNYNYIAWNTSNFYKIDGDDDFVTFKKARLSGTKRFLMEQLMIFVDGLMKVRQVYINLLNGFKEAINLI